MAAVLTNPLRVGLRQERVIAPQIIVIFGASGDLTHRKLIPALFELHRQRRLPSEFAVLGCARRPWSDEEFRSRMASSLSDVIAEDPVAWENFAAGLFYESADLSNPSTIVSLGERLEPSTGPGPPAATAPSTSRCPRRSTAAAPAPWRRRGCSATRNAAGW